jgi:hypothetical protein
MKNASLLLAWMILAVTAHAESSAQTWSVNGTTMAASGVNPGDSCPTNGSMAEAAGGAAVLACSSHKWQDFSKLEQASLQLSIDDLSQAGGTHAEFTFTTSIGIPSAHKSETTEDSNVPPQPGAAPVKPDHSLYVAATVVSFNADNTAHVLVDLASTDGGRDWSKSVDVTVPVGVKTVVAKDSVGVQYTVKVTKQES